ncbi:MarR family transcriptional regulator [Sphingomonas sp. HF-S3]|uniref:MarR family transcriptional regulator n=1 Tax=Sphingomonas rustica TaxID=3103142 RepID=A0ABV0B4T4_9SPHN
MMKEGQDLLEIVGYQVQRAELLMDRDARATLSPYDVTPTKMTALILIRDNPGSDQSALGKALRVNRSSAMKLVNLLVDRGLIERRPGRDLRTNALHLTDEGETLVAAMLADLRASDARMTAALTGEEIKTLVRLLRKLGRPAPKPRAQS